MASLLSLSLAAILVFTGSALASPGPISSLPPVPPPKPQPKLPPRPVAVPEPFNATEQFLKAHDGARAAVGVAPLRWSPRLAATARGIAKYQKDHLKCEFADLGSSPYGANQAWTSYPASPWTAVGSWAEEKNYYNHTSNTCTEGHDCETYKQVVWKRTVDLGCAQATCAGGATLTICLYNPHGNVRGQWPY